MISQKNYSETDCLSDVNELGDWETKTTFYRKYQQAGTGPSRRHIQGSKIPKRLPSIKYSLLQYSKIKNFSKIFFEITYSKKWTEWRAKVSQCRKTEREDPLGFFNIHSVAKHQKLKGGKIFIFGKKSHSAEKTLKGPFGIFQHPF